MKKYSLEIQWKYVCEKWKGKFHQGLVRVDDSKYYKYTNDPPIILQL